ncbi:hypothetical protein KC19_3G080800 [Ceratodon purpureus]|uniref:Secreted protein n=1 Tax=Ceratodon purpureus TaxID=3225 RepID=A0A8T0IIM9_CERPU|nr:hypothetical protein KC19_3G080800 [Ceratodon purpureus]
MHHVCVIFASTVLHWLPALQGCSASWGYHALGLAILLLVMKDQILLYPSCTTSNSPPFYDLLTSVF